MRPLGPQPGVAAPGVGPRSPKRLPPLAVLLRSGSWCLTTTRA